MELTEGMMSEAIQADPVVTVARFDAFLDSQVDDSLWELVAGRIVAMTNPTEVHEKIATNIGAPLAIAVDPAPTGTAGSGPDPRRWGSPRLPESARGPSPTS